MQYLRALRALKFSVMHLANCLFVLEIDLRAVCITLDKKGDNFDFVSFCKENGNEFIKNRCNKSSQVAVFSVKMLSISRLVLLELSKGLKWVKWIMLFTKFFALFALFTLSFIRDSNGPKLSPVNQAVANDYYRFSLHHQL